MKRLFVIWVISNWGNFIVPIDSDACVEFLAIEVIVDIYTKMNDVIWDSEGAGKNMAGGNITVVGRTYPCRDGEEELVGVFTRVSQPVSNYF